MIPSTSLSPAPSSEDPIASIGRGEYDSPLSEEITRSDEVNAEAEAEGSRPIKRPRHDLSDRSSVSTTRASPRKRVREATPICDEGTDDDAEEDKLEIEEDEEQEAGGSVTPMEPTTSGLEYGTITEVGESSKHVDTLDERVVVQVNGTSDCGEPSVLFSEPGRITEGVTEPTEALEHVPLEHDQLEDAEDEEEPLVDDAEEEEDGDEDEDCDDDEFDLELRGTTAVEAEDYPEEEGLGFEPEQEYIPPLDRPLYDSGLVQTMDQQEDLSRSFKLTYPRSRIDAYRMGEREDEDLQDIPIPYSMNKGNVKREKDEFKPMRRHRTFPVCEGEPEPHSYHSGDSIDYEMDHRPILDRTAVKRDIKEFCAGVRLLNEPDDSKRMYKVVDRLGEGTFSSVYLAHDRLHGKFFNEWWTGRRDTRKRSRIHAHDHEVKVALKKILVTSSPMRIENELHILECLRGCRNVSQLITAFRDDDQVIIVLPFHRSDDFRHFYRHMDAHHIQRYMKCLLRALKDIHQRGIVHRDVKPANFLFDYETSDGVLCDFGLAERYYSPRRATCQHAPATLETLGGSKTKTSDTPIVEQALYDARKRARLPEGRIGFHQEDKRPAIKTNRAGTRGFRAPEVLLKCPDQTVAIDVWSAGVMLLSILTHKFPIFNSADDIEALMEIAAIFGRAAMERCALLHNRTIMTNVPTVDSAPPSLNHLILKLNPHLYTPPINNPTIEEARRHVEAMDGAIDLCTQLLRLDATKRITAARALNHVFFQKGDDFWQPEPEKAGAGSEDGKCGNLHEVEAGRHRAWFGKEVEELQFGQGIPPSAEELCPEHEHWQQRTLLNPLAVSTHYRNLETTVVDA